MASGNSGGDGSDQRAPKTAKDLLAICAQHTDPDNPNANVSFNTMEPERKEWLEKALNDISVNPVMEMKLCVDCILNSESDTDARLDALEKLMEWCDHIDFAIDFHKIGGFEIFPKCEEDAEPEVRAQALEVIATIVQNNPYCQKAVIENKLLPKLIHALDNDSSYLVKRKALYALSCLVRDYPEALDHFISNDGFSCLMRAMQTNEEKIKTKAAFMICGICGDNDKCKDILCDIGMIQQLVGHLSEEHSTFHEHLVSALLTVVRGHPRSLQECRQPELGLVTLLAQKQQELADKDQFREELEYVTELLGLLKQNGEQEMDVAR